MKNLNKDIDSFYYYNVLFNNYCNKRAKNNKYTDDGVLVISIDKSKITIYLYSFQKLLLTKKAFNKLLIPNNNNISKLIAALSNKTIETESNKTIETELELDINSYHIYIENTLQFSIDKSLPAINNNISDNNNIPDNILNKTKDKEKNIYNNFISPNKSHTIHAHTHKTPPNITSDTLVLNRKFLNSQYPVIVDKFLSKKLMEFQKQGVIFLYNCIMGISNNNYGCILADQMGLGKTFEIIALIYTLLHSGPDNGNPVLLKKILIICPATLIGNWKNEFNKWLGIRLKPVILSSDNNNSKNEDILKIFSINREKVLLTGYECFRSNFELFQELGLDKKVDLLICDEGHRLKKQSGNKTINALSILSTKRRIILTGTPIQNNLEELYALCNFVNPCILGEYSTFKNIYEIPISDARDERISGDTKDIAFDRAKELSLILSSFILRRSVSVLSSCLPRRTETILFCQCSDFQLSIYKKIISYISEVPALSLISLIRQLITHPIIIYKKFFDEEEKINLDLEPLFPSNYKPKLEESGKLLVLEDLLRTIKDNTKDKVVIASNHTKTLDTIEHFIMKSNNFSYFRLDGHTPQNERMHIVNNFNDPHNSTSFFLITSKTGGVGLNLVGANRIILVDPEWNFAVDDQVMGRIYRKEQHKDVFIYRLISLGTLEEKIFQRQLFKHQYSSIVSDYSNVDIVQMPVSELKEIFALNEDFLVCSTQNILNQASRELISHWSTRITDQDFVLKKVANIKFYISNTNDIPVSQDLPEVKNDFNISLSVEDKIDDGSYNKVGDETNSLFNQLAETNKRVISDDSDLKEKHFFTKKQKNEETNNDADILEI